MEYSSKTLQKLLHLPLAKSILDKWDPQKSILPPSASVKGFNPLQRITIAYNIFINGGTENLCQRSKNKKEKLEKVGSH